MAQPEGYVRLFLDARPSLAPLLYAAAQRGIVPDYCGQLLVPIAEEQDPSLVSLPQRPATPPLIEPLSERELEVLRLVSSGLTNREIGLRLHLSPNTIKRHTLNIYEKLGVHSRTEAVAKARTLGLLT
jgi:LuxR family maltose regulon positive regulatory protein